VVAYGAFTFVSALAIFGVLKATIGIRVSEEEELEGLDLAEHGMHAYDGLGSIGRSGMADELAIKLPAAAHMGQVRTATAES